MRRETAVADPADREGGLSEPQSLADLYRQQYGRMVRLAYLLTGSNEVAEELVQDVFARLYRRWDRAEHPRAYLRAAVVNACRSHQRRMRLERTHRAEAVSASSMEPDELWDALASLPGRQRTALVLRFYEDLPEIDIARALGCRPGTVKSLISRGLAQLRRVIEQ